MAHRIALTLSTALFVVAWTGCGGTTTTTTAPQPAVVATEPTVVTVDEPGIHAPALRRLPRDVDCVMRVHLGAVRGTAFEDVVLGRFPLSSGAQRDLQVDILSDTDVVTIGLGDQSVGWVFEGELGGRFDAIVELLSANDAAAVTGEAGQRSFGDERAAIGEVGEDTLSLHIPAGAASETGEIPPAVLSPELQQLGAALPVIPAGRAILFEAWAAPAWGLFRDLKLVARMTYGRESNDIHIDAALLYPDAEIAAARASGWREFWDAFVEESPQSFDRDSATVRSDGATVVLHHELRQLVGEPAAHERVIMWTLMSLAAHQPAIDYR